MPGEHGGAHAGGMTTHTLPGQLFLLLDNTAVILATTTITTMTS